jgi:N-acylneuraminate cytidylyltransferase
MLDGKRILALIPARGGSKRLPRKNVLLLKGKPLIEWSINAAQFSQYVDEVFVSSDDTEILDVVAKTGLGIQQPRPNELASDTATTDSVIKHVLEVQKPNFDILVLLQPTSPLRNSHHIDQALELYLKKSANSVVSVTECEHSPLWSNTLAQDGSMCDFITEKSKKRAQDLETYFRLNGAIYIYDIKAWLNNSGSRYDENTFAYVMDAKDSVDIDNQLDFEFAEFLMGKNS